MACVDQNWWHLGNNTDHNCAWIAENPEQRCSDHPASLVHCKVTCGDCKSNFHSHGANSTDTVSAINGLSIASCEPGSFPCDATPIQAVSMGLATGGLALLFSVYLFRSVSFFSLFLQKSFCYVNFGNDLCTRFCYLCFELHNIRLKKIP